MIFWRAKPAGQAKLRTESGVQYFLRRLKKICLWLLALLILIFIISSYIYLHRPSTLPIKTIQVLGEYSHIDNRTVENIVLPDVQNGLLNLNLSTLQQALLQLPWLERVEIRKIWPDTIVIYLYQQVPVAYWNEKSLLNDTGVIFTPPHLKDLPADLPYFNGPDSQSAAMLAAYRDMTQRLQPLGLSVLAINLSQRHAWTVTLSNGIILILGREDFADRLQRFITVYPNVLSAKAGRVQSVDLRYNSGLAVEWKR